MIFNGTITDKRIFALILANCIYFSMYGHSVLVQPTCTILMIIYGGVGGNAESVDANRGHSITFVS